MVKKNDDFFSEKKPWSKVKDGLLGCYLRPYVQKILHTNKPLIYVDCFAGKGKFDDGNPGSPLIALEILTQCIRSTKMRIIPKVEAVFVDLNNASDLKENLKGYSDIDVKIIPGKYEEKIDELLKDKTEYNVFLYIDPYGIKALNCSKFDVFANRFQSIELLINMNSFGFTREACRILDTQFKTDDANLFDDLVEYESAEPDASGSALLESMQALDNIAGGDYWKTIIKRYKEKKINGYEAEECFAKQYCERLNERYKYVLNMPIRIQKGQHSKYRMIHVTNHPEGCLLMVDNMCKRWEVLQKLQTGGQLFLWDEDINNQPVSEEDIEDKLEGHLSERRFWPSQTTALASFFVKHGVICSTGDIIRILEKFKETKRIIIRRDPSTTKTGVPTSFKREGKGRSISIEWCGIMKVAGYIKRESMLYQTGVEYGDYTLNHVLGCAHGCKYPCYAYLLKKRFGQVKNYVDWCRPYLVSNTMELLEREIPRLKKKIKYVQLCFTTDPFMFQYPEVAEMSIAAIKKLNENQIKCCVLTKGIIPVELANLYEENEYGITLISLDENYRKRIEPGAAPYIDRISALKALHDKGCKTWVSIEPYPTPNLIQQDLRKILEAVSFADKIIFGRTNYSKEVSAYKDHKHFYDAQAKLVIKFCEDRNIQYHIKKKTIDGCGEKA